MKQGDCWRFRIRLDKAHYYNVVVFRSRSTMIQYYKLWRGETDPHTIWRSGKPDPIYRTFEAICSSFDEYKKRRRTGLCGQILFHLGWLGAGIVSHEMTHAALSLATKGKRLWAEERVCCAVQRLTAQFWHKFYGGKLDKQKAWRE